MKQKEGSAKVLLGVIGIVTIFVLVIIDQYTKALAVTYLKGQNPIEIVTDVFELRYLENFGAAFGMLQGKKTFFIISTSIITVLLSCLYFYIPAIKRFHLVRVILILFISGAIGNFIDRCMYDYVRDFFYFKLIDFPIFNMADIYVSVAAVILILTFFFYYKEEDMDKMIPDIFHKKKVEDKNKS